MPRASVVRRVLYKQAGFATILIYLGFAAAIVGTVAGLYLTITRTADRAGYERGIGEARRAAEIQRARESLQAMTAAERGEKDRVKIRTVYRTITQSVDRVVAADPAYADMCLPDTGVRSANAALRGPAGTRPDQPQPDNPLPGPYRAPGRPAWDGAAKAGGDR